MSDDVADPSWKSWARLMPPRRPRGNTLNTVRALVAAQISHLSDEERDQVADFVDAFEQRGSTAPIAVRLQMKALAILALKRENPEAFAR